MPFTYTRRTFANHGPTPISFLQDLLDWAKTAPDEIFAPNAEPEDCMNLIKPALIPARPWASLRERKAALLDAAVVHAGYESDWNWHEGVDTTNATSMANKTGQETGPWQISFNISWLDHHQMEPFCREH